MKSYPHLGYYNESQLGQNIYAFDKKDGSNLRFE